jgi:hypothetical protein
MRATAHRVIIALYCIFIAYCSLWLPWHRHISASSDVWYADDYVRLGYGWLWAGPTDAGKQDVFSTPDLVLIGLRLVAISAVAGAVFVLSDILWTKVSGSIPD